MQVAFKFFPLFPPQERREGTMKIAAMTTMAVFAGVAAQASEPGQPAERIVTVCMEHDPSGAVGAAGICLLFAITPRIFHGGVDRQNLPPLKGLGQELRV